MLMAHQHLDHPIQTIIKIHKAILWLYYFYSGQVTKGTAHPPQQQPPLGSQMCLPFFHESISMRINEPAQLFCLSILFRGINIESLSLQTFLSPFGPSKWQSLFRFFFCFFFINWYGHDTFVENYQMQLLLQEIKTIQLFNFTLFSDTLIENKVYITLKILSWTPL